MLSPHCWGGYSAIRVVGGWTCPELHAFPVGFCLYFLMQLDAQQVLLSSSSGESQPTKIRQKVTLGLVIPQYPHYHRIGLRERPQKRLPVHYKHCLHRVKIWYILFLTANAFLMMAHSILIWLSAWSTHENHQNIMTWSQVGHRTNWYNLEDQKLL